MASERIRNVLLWEVRIVVRYEVSHTKGRICVIREELCSWETGTYLEVGRNEDYG